MKEVSKAVNDVYLKANDQEDGMKSYGRMVDLLLAEYFDESVSDRSASDKPASDKPVSE